MLFVLGAAAAEGSPLHASNFSRMDTKLATRGSALSALISAPCERDDIVRRLLLLARPATRRRGVNEQISPGREQALAGREAFRVMVVAGCAGDGGGDGVIECSVNGREVLKSVLAAFGGELPQRPRKLSTPKISGPVPWRCNWRFLQVCATPP
jgi:hypothetical protein